MAVVLMLGGNTFRDSNGTLKVEGLEVFRLRERTGDGRLVVDFEVRDQGGEIIAKIAENTVVYAREGLNFRSAAGVSEVYDQATGRSIARAEEQSPDTVVVTGVFVVNGVRLVIDADGVTIDGNRMRISGCTFNGSHTAVEIARGNFKFG